MAQRCRQRPLGCPTVAKSRPERAIWQAKLSRPFRDAERSAFEGNVTIATRVLRLLSTRGPAAVSRLVVPVVIDAFQCAATWCRSHVLNEIQARRAPAVANRDASAAPHSKSCSVRVVAAPLHLLPSTSFCRFVKAVLNPGRSLQTTATLRVSTAKTLRIHQVLVSARAPATPNGSLANSSRSQFKDCQSPECLVSQVKWWSHTRLHFITVPR